MKREEATAGLAYLVAATMGWTDEAVDVYVHKLSELEEPETLQQVCKRLADTWDQARRPLMAEITNLYYSEIRSRNPKQRELPPSNEKLPKTFGEGIAIAKRAYEAECYRQGREPSMAFFGKWIGSSVPRPTAEGEPEPW